MHLTALTKETYFKECKAHYGPRFKEMKALHDQEELEKLDKIAKQNAQKELCSVAILPSLGHKSKAK